MSAVQLFWLLVAGGAGLAIAMAFVVFVLIVREAAVGFLRDKSGRTTGKGN